MTDALLTAYIAILVLISAGMLLVEVVKKLEQRSAIRSETVGVGRVIVMVPCKGSDISLPENLLSLRNQDYGAFDLVAVVDSETDVALPSIKEAGIRYIVSDSQCERCSGKVRAIASAFSSFPDFDVYVIADSDATFSHDWLRTLVSPLEDKRYGISTTFPIFFPIGGFWSRVKMVWGFVGRSMMESRITRFGWGGSLAFRRSLLDGENFQAFSESVSDDTALTRFSSTAGLKIAYCDGNIVRVKAIETFSSFVEWSNRQTALAIHGSRNLYGFGMAYYSARLFLLVSSVAMSLFLSPLALLLLTPFAVNMARIYHISGSRDPGIVPIFLSMDAFYLANLLKARRMEKITWRGSEYSLTAE